MSYSKKLATAALAGILTTAAMGVSVAHAAEPAAGGAMEKAASADQGADKHACKGLNACKGQGADGKNACKGQGGCATDSSKPAN